VCTLLSVVKCLVLDLSVTGSARSDVGSQYRNPASPDVLTSPPPWETSRTATPTASSSVTSMNTLAQAESNLPRPIPLPTSPRPAGVNSPTRTRSLGDLLSEHERSKNRDRQAERDLKGSNGVTHLPNVSAGSLHKATPSAGDAPGEEVREDQHDNKEKEPYVGNCTRQ
jgi:hypothetical protein